MEAVPLEDVVTSSYSVYISKKPVIKDVAELTKISRHIYPLLDMSQLVEELANDVQKETAIKRHSIQLAKINTDLKLEKDSREPFEAHRNIDKAKVTKRDTLIFALEMEERTAASDRWEEIDEWARLYIQLPEPLTAYRTYYQLQEDTYTLYIEENVSKPKAIVVCTTFADSVAKKVIEEWCE
jgi:hypothetical protein